MNIMKNGSQNPLPTSIDALILPSTSHNFSQTLSSIKRSRLSIKNRLISIHEDAQFVQEVAVATCLPLIANERCGNWYIPTDKKIGSAYFKSTDGHQGQWKFSLRRLNLQVLDIVTKHNGYDLCNQTCVNLEADCIKVVALSWTLRDQANLCLMHCQRRFQYGVRYGTDYSFPSPRRIMPCIRLRESSGGQSMLRSMTDLLASLRTLRYLLPQFSSVLN